MLEVRTKCLSEVRSQKIVGLCRKRYLGLLSAFVCCCFAKNELGTGRSSDLSVCFSLRIQSMLNYKLFALKKSEAGNLRKAIDDHNKVSFKQR